MVRATPENYLHHDLANYLVKLGGVARVVDSGGTAHTQHILEREACASIPTWLVLNGSVQDARTTSHACTIRTPTSWASASGPSDLIGRLAVVLELILVILVYLLALNAQLADEPFHDTMTSRTLTMYQTPAQHQQHHRQHHQQTTRNVQHAGRADRPLTRNIRLTNVADCGGTTTTPTPANETQKDDDQHNHEHHDQ